MAGKSYDGGSDNKKGNLRPATADSTASSSSTKTSGSSVDDVLGSNLGYLAKKLPSHPTQEIAKTLVRNLNSADLTFDKVAFELRKAIEQYGTDKTADKKQAILSLTNVIKNFFGSILDKVETFATEEVNKGNKVSDQQIFAEIVKGLAEKSAFQSSSKPEINQQVSITLKHFVEAAVVPAVRNVLDRDPNLRGNFSDVPGKPSTPSLAN